MSTTENNKLIAEFMGCNPIFKDKKEYQMVTHENMCYGANELQYHKDWNWLMEVVEKISNIKHWSLNATIDWLSESQNRDGIYTIQDMYESVVEFIKEYNKQSK